MWRKKPSWENEESGASSAGSVPLPPLSSPLPVPRVVQEARQGPESSSLHFQLLCIQSSLYIIKLLQMHSTPSKLCILIKGASHFIHRGGAVIKYQL